ncbi:microsomal triglyceride transfer protein-like isoform X2 [Electrophorus electricus]|uniref:microsomal triglyceride transfer protein-like isoform X2 n=1 Tax=Electrophorus electricus TaxID=8005 RepID=UPI0015D0122C|nr:microsomal triglyceride transfer protein-like isoform X2 [Electrophorus electricus]
MQRLVAFLLCATALVGVPSQGASAGPRLNNGWLYRFHYNVELGLNRPRASARGTAGFQISSDVDISLTWRNPENQDEQLLRVQISNVQLQSAVQRSGKNNIFHGSTTESILGREKLEALQRPFMLLWKMGKLKANKDLLVHLGSIYSRGHMLHEDQQYFTQAVVCVCFSVCVCVCAVRLR